MVKIDWKKVGASIVNFLKKYWVYILIAIIAIVVGWKLGWKNGLITGLLGGSAGTAGKIFSSNKENRKKRGDKADELLEKAKGGTKIPFIFLLVFLLILGFPAMAAPGTVPIEEYLKVVDQVADLQNQIVILNTRLEAAIQAAELYKTNWEEAEKDLDLALENNDLLEKDKLTLITKINELQSRKFGVQAMVVYDGELSLALAGSYNNFLVGATYNIKTQTAGLMAGFKVDF